MRDVIVSGYVQKEIKRDSKVTKFQISNYKYKQNDKAVYQYLSIRANTPDLSISEGDFVLVKGELDIFDYNEKKYTQINAFADGIGIIRQASSGSMQRDEIPW